MKRGVRYDGELILEIGTEEIPSRLIPSTIVELRDKATRFLMEDRISAKHIEVFATPRRLTIRAAGIPSRQEARISEKKGPPYSVAYDAQGNPTRAAISFAEAIKLSVNALETKETQKGRYIFGTFKEPVQPAHRILRRLLPALISSLSFPKTMRWDQHGLRFIRPIRWIVAVFDGTVVPFHIAGLTSGNLSRGHRFMADRSFAVKNWDGYCKTLRRLHVILDPMQRKQVIGKGLERLARQKKGRVMKDESLLEQAAYLTEEPSVMIGGFDKRYLALPPEVLIAVMKEHQGYFSMVDRSGNLKPYFLFVSNIQSRRPHLIQQGNERVLRARLEDARFYIERDRKRKLEDHVGNLNGLSFHSKLESMYHKMERLQKLGTTLLKKSGRGDQETIHRLENAAKFCKTDLLTGMVREFPKLEGFIGREYMLQEGGDPEVAEAIAEHYFPRYAEDPKEPRTVTGKFLTAADRVDTLVGFFGVDLIPSGSMDPYALRRQGMGLIQVLLDEAFSRMSLGEVIEEAARLYSDHSKIRFKKGPEVIRKELEIFLIQRMGTYLRRRFSSTREYRSDLADAVLSRPFDVPVDLFRRFVALMAFQKEKGFEPLIIAFKRAARIIPKGFSHSVEPGLFKEAVERDLWTAYNQVSAKIKGLLNRHHHSEVLSELTSLREPIDRFFNGVLVMEEDQKIRANRLALLKAIRDLFDQFADFSCVMVTTASDHG